MNRHELSSVSNPTAIKRNQHIPYPVGYTGTVNTFNQTTIFSDWLSVLADKVAKARIVARIEAAKMGNFGDCEPVGEGVSEMRIDVGAGYRAYYMRDGLVVYLLLCGGDKTTQQADIKRAIAMAKQVKAAKEAAKKAAVSKDKSKSKAKAKFK